MSTRVKKILFLGCNHNQVPYIEELKKMNFYVVGVDGNKNSPGLNLCDSFYNLRYDNYDDLIEVGKKEKFTSDDKVFTASAQFAHRGASIFANFFKINYPKLELIDFCLDKTSYYNYFIKNNIPIPRTYYIKNENDLVDKLDNYNSNKWFFLKSDYSKNPNYVYRINRKSLNQTNIFWGRDRYLVNHYILQEEFIGQSLRINVFGDNFNIINFNNSVFTSKYNKMLKSFGTIEKLKEIISFLNMKNWLLKFDIIVNESSYVVLDIGIDPPSRMLKKSKEVGVNFYKYYLNQYLNNKINYPKSLNEFF